MTVILLLEVKRPLGIMTKEGELEHAVDEPPTIRSQQRSEGLRSPLQVAV
jgi:hypothetical protein